MRDQGSFKGPDMAEFVLQVRKMYGSGKKIALFGDNAGINKCDEIRDAAELAGYNLAKCRLIYN